MNTGKVSTKFPVLPAHGPDPSPQKPDPKQSPGPLIHLQSGQSGQSGTFVGNKEKKNRCDRLTPDQLLLLFITAPQLAPPPERNQTRAAPRPHLRVPSPDHKKGSICLL
ncbi:hypothetical protein EYF80_065950 [Liparis tanakae]|uniref:Uncharacterized protein n=1 Tax=Liparis tanakae TaxID=230148 RepID=A0A4Z2E5D2_9TELE|nr:hypothetical protein EYF80_065950 [Liparis tanakae]